MSLGKKEFVIADLIRKELLVGELSIEENAFLQEWLSVPENQEYYQKVVDLETLKSKETFYKTVNTDLAFERIKEKMISEDTPVISLFNYRRIFKYAIQTICSEVIQLESLLKKLHCFDLVVFDIAQHED